MISLIGIIVTLIVVGLLLWAAEQIPMDATIKKIIQVVVIVVVILWLLQAIGVLGSVGSIGIK
jgi:uncharacterized membrane protein YwzB